MGDVCGVRGLLSIVQHSMLNNHCHRAFVLTPCCCSDVGLRASTNWKAKADSHIVDTWVNIRLSHYCSDTVEPIYNLCWPTFNIQYQRRLLVVIRWSLVTRFIAKNYHRSGSVVSGALVQMDIGLKALPISHSVHRSKH